ncbi:sugar phosphate isomerase/epimerase [Methanobrevibacter sp. OttesenSCG-928-K11]|nr:sugar phosphate isomerase/epimerase [Methanobrevibacter sp. OttesenSCG-928-K11]MDL2270456.1 sugar phosphate isomerase/epimerase [Methanobrevibacter sp. OttesenSCG-928-I08]
MKLGFSTLSLFMKTFDEILQIATDNGFEMIELLTEGPYNSENLLNNKKLLEPFHSYDIEVNIHGPTVDLNLASLNEGIRKESVRQVKKTLDLGNEINANFITIHPGQVGRREEHLRKIAIDFSKESIKDCVDYSENFKSKISVENMPWRFSFLGNKVDELKDISENTGSYITIDLGHANTTPQKGEFLNIDKISYCHLNDNHGEKDQHLALGLGTLDLDLLKKVKNGIIELNDFEQVLKSKKVIEELV